MNERDERDRIETGNQPGFWNKIQLKDIQEEEEEEEEEVLLLLLLLLFLLIFSFLIPVTGMR